MKLVGLMPVRNEEWCLGLTLRAALMWCDELCVCNHASTDATADILGDIQAEFSARVHVVSFPKDVWTEMAQRQTLLEMARERGATNLAMIDADEVLTGNLLPTIRELIFSGAPGMTLQLPWLALPRTLERYLTSGVWGPGQQVSMAFKDQPSAHWTALNGYDFHHRNPMGLPPGAFLQPLKPHQGGLMHLQFLSERRLRAKQALYQVTEVLRWPGRKTPRELAQMYGLAVYESDPAKHASVLIPRGWWEPYSDLMKHLDIDAEPWQEVELKRLIAEHGREKFTGLDLFGIV
jgi:hypothetical protein